MEKRNSMRPVPHKDRILTSSLHGLFQLGGLGLDIAEVAMFGLADRDFYAAIGPVTLPATFDLGIDFESDEAGCGIWRIDTILDSPDMLPEGPGSTAHDLGRIMETRRLIWCVPVIGSPGATLPTLSECDWVHGDHFAQLLEHVHRHPGCLDQVPSGLPPRPRSWRKRVQAPASRALIRASDVKRFCHFFPEVADQLWDAMVAGGAPGAKQCDRDEANARASDFLGIEADLSHGFLFPLDRLDWAIELAMCDRGAIDAVSLVPPAFARAARHPSLVGACWSFTLNRALNGDLQGRPQGLGDWVTRSRPLRVLWPETCRAT